ncbi:MAG: DUF1549 domain-containing protein [Pirellulales bacterium]
MPIRTPTKSWSINCSTRPTTASNGEDGTGSTWPAIRTTKGYVYAREERFWTHAWAYRPTGSCRRLNRDLPYDRFLMLQLAADQVPDHQPSDLAAMGFLTVGRRFLGVKHDIIDDRIDAIFRGHHGADCGLCAVPRS